MRVIYFWMWVSFLGFSCSDESNALEPAKPTTEGLVAYYTFEDNANDEVGDNDAVTTNLSYSLFDTKHKKAASFSALNESKGVIDNTFDYENKTISLWFKANEINTTQSVIFVSDNPNKQFGLVGAQVIEESAHKNLILNIGGGTLAVTTIPVEEGIWYHITLVGEGKNFSYYFNGELVRSGINTGYLNSSVGFEDTILGASRTSILYFDGSMDNFRVYNRALTAEEIKVLAAN